MARQIPKKLLIHQATYNEYLGNTGEDYSYDDDITLSNVRVEEIKTIVRGKDGDEIISNSLMFYDLVNSSGLTSMPVVNSKVTYNNKLYHIIDIEKLDTYNSHHYEIVLK